MGFLDRVEDGLERGFNSVFARTFRSGVQPIELGSALKNELDTHTQIVSSDRILVPNEFTILLAPEDFKRLSELGPTLTDDLIDIVQEHAMRQGYQFIGGIDVQLKNDERLPTGDSRIESRSIKTQVVWAAILEHNGTSTQLRNGRTVIGRSSSSDLQLTDSGISKAHAAINWDGAKATIEDLGSTNGTKLNGSPISRPVALSQDSVIQIGRLQLVFKLQPLRAR